MCLIETIKISIIVKTLIASRNIQGKEKRRHEYTHPVSIDFLHIISWDALGVLRPKGKIKCYF